jgi:hypothetical protein
MKSAASSPYDRCRLYFVLAILGVAMLGCSAHGPLFDPAASAPRQGQGTIVVYRISRGPGAANAWYLNANGRPLTVITNGGYYAYQADPGNVTFSARLKPNVLNWWAVLLGFHDLITVPVEAGQVYYVRFNLFETMEMIDQETALKELHELRAFDAAS